MIFNKILLKWNMQKMVKTKIGIYNSVSTRKKIKCAKNFV